MSSLFPLNNGVPEMKLLDNAVAQNRWNEFNDNREKPGCLATFLPPDGPAVEISTASDMDLDLFREVALSTFLTQFPVTKIVKWFVSGRCFFPGCEDFGHRVNCWGTLEPPLTQ